jgi:hypothetical protein
MIDYTFSVEILLGFLCEKTDEKTNIRVNGHTPSILWVRECMGF